MRAFFEDLAQILRFGGRELAHAEVIEDEQVGSREFVAIAKVRPAGPGEREILQPRRDGHVQHRLAARAGVQPCGLRDEGLAHAGLADQQHRSSFAQPLQAVELFDLCLADRAAGSEVDIFERRP